VWLAVRSPPSRNLAAEEDGEMMARESDHRRVAGQRGVADGEGVGARERRWDLAYDVGRDLAARAAELHQRLKTCRSRRKCEDHSALVKREMGVPIDDRAIAALASRAVPAIIASHAGMLAWISATAAELNETAKRLGKLVEDAPEDAPVKLGRDGLAAILHGHVVKTRELALFYAKCQARASPSSSELVPSASPIDDLALVARNVEMWVRQQALTCQCCWQVVVGILTHYGWAISGSSVQHKADALRHLGSRRRNRA
jgi:hypothetical protein